MYAYIVLRINVHSKVQNSTICSWQYLQVICGVCVCMCVCVWCIILYTCIFILFSSQCMQYTEKIVQFCLNVGMPVQESSRSEEEEEGVLIRYHDEIMCNGGHSWIYGNPICIVFFDFWKLNNATIKVLYMGIKITVQSLIYLVF